MFAKLLVALTLIPVFELFFVIEVGRRIGTFPAVVIVLITGVLGAYLAKEQGFAVFKAVQRDLEVGRVPGEKMLEGVFVLLGGVLLLTPGFLTDLLGFSFLLGFFRKFWVQTALVFIKRHFRILP